MAGEVCARCLWAGPATSAPDGVCPVCGSPLTFSSAPTTTDMVDMVDAVDAVATPASAADAGVATAPEAVDNPFAAEITSAPGSDPGSGRRSAIPRGRWALLAVNGALLVVCVALMASTALGWRPVGAGVANASSANPSATATTPSSAIPSTGPDALLPTPTATTTPTPNGAGGSGGGFAPTATPTATPAVAPTPTPAPTTNPGN